MTHLMQQIEESVLLLNIKINMQDKILIIEDDPFTIQFYNFLFKRTAFEIKITDNGDTLIDYLKNDSFSVILLDVNLKNTFIMGKKVDGIEISKFLKNHNHYAHIPIILVTAYQDKINGLDLLKESCADDFIRKPISDYNQLIDKINKYIENGKN